MARYFAEHVSSSDFGSEVDKLWQSAERIKKSVISEVESQNLPTITGLGILSCVTGQVFGYQLFHGQPNWTDLALTNRD